MPDVEVMQVIKTNLDLRGDGDETPYHRVTQYWDMDGELLWEDCPPGGV